MILCNYKLYWKTEEVLEDIFISDDDIDAIIEAESIALPDFNIENVKDAPVPIIPTIILNRSGFERDGSPSNEIENGWGYYDCGLHNMNLLLKAHELGLATLVMGLRDVTDIRNLLSINDKESIVSVIAVGYGNINHIMPKRKTVEDITKFY